MAGKLSFSIAINLLTENFKRGTNQVKAGFRAMQMQVLTFAAALGAGGLGLSNLVSRFVDVARETNRVTTSLKNVSGSMGQFADNQRYLLGIAKKYGLEINALTGNFAKFTASAAISGMSMTEQRKVFESVSRACTAFGMSADDSNGVFLALSQMMSKGKISSEELRLQMGERLPVALQAMAKAAGVSVAGLDKLLKQGKLMSADVLPKFADALNEMIPNVDTDNLETSVNRLKNVFTEFVNGTDAQNKYKMLIDWLTVAIQSAADNIKNIVVGVVAVITGLIANTVTKAVKEWGTTASQLAAFSNTANNRMLSATARRVTAEQALEKAKLQQALAVGSQKIIAAEMVAKAETKLATATATEVKAKEVAKAAEARASAVASSTAWGKAYSVIKIGAAKVLASLRVMWNTFAPMIIVSAIAAIIGKFKLMYDEAKRIKSIFSSYKKEAESIGNTQEIIMLEKQLKIMNDKKQSQENINNAQAELQKMLGKEYKSQEDLNKAVAKRIELLREAARADFFARKQVEFEDKNKTLSNSIGLSSDQAERLAKLYSLKDSGENNRDRYYQEMGRMYRENGVKGKYDATAADKAISEISKNLEVIANASSELEKATLKSNTLTKPTITPDDSKEKKTPLEKQQESYNKQFEELGAELEIGKITQAEYNKALAELNIKMFAQAKGTGDKDVLESEYFKARKAAAEKAVNNMPQLNANVELEKVQKEYGDALLSAKTKLDKKLIAEEDYRKAIVDAAVKAAESAVSIEGIGNAANEFVEKVRSIAIENITKPIFKGRDTTFDYKATGVDKADGELTAMKKYADELKDKIKEGAIFLQDEFNNAIANVDSLEEALKLAKVKQDVVDFGKELNESLYSGVKDVAGSADRVVGAFRNLRDVMNDVDSTGWEKIMSIWNAMINTVDSFMSIVNTIENVSALVAKLAGAKEKQKSLEQGVTETVLTTGAQIVANQIATEMEITTSQRKTEAATAEMAAKSTAAYAGIPFGGVALAAGQIAAMMGMIEAAKSSVPKFATGGIYTGGTASGDKGLARLNKGEMILNHGQQSNLFAAINSGRLGGGSHVRVSGDVKLRGSDLYLSFDNYKKKTGKK